MPSTYVITGTSRGIGLELTRQLLESGHLVHALARTPEKTKALSELKARHSQRLSIHAVDVESDSDVERFVGDLGSSAKIDVLINNAGVYGEHGTLEELDLEDVAKTMAINAIAPIRVTRALLPLMTGSASPKIAHITSLMGSIADNSSGGAYGYRMSKAALNMFNKSLSADHPNVICLVVHPGWVKTDMGGDNAPTLPSESARGILSVVTKATPRDTGKFYDFEGEELPW